MELLDAFRWRYATKKYDSRKKIDQTLVDKILEAAWIAPTSSGLQPFEVFVITNQELKEKIVSETNAQELVAQCSHLLVFAAWDNYTAERIDKIYAHITAGREQASDRYNAYTDRLKNKYLNRPTELNFEHAARQSYIAFSFAMAEAASLRVDCTPMEGFLNEELDKLLQLPEKGLKSVTMLPLGYRDEKNDWLLHLKKVRHPFEDFITIIE